MSTETLQNDISVNIQENTSVDKENIIYKSKHIPKHFRKKNENQTITINPQQHLFQSYTMPIMNIKRPSTIQMFKDTVSMNYWYFLALAGCCWYYGESISHSLLLVITFFGAGIIGYFIHMFSHNVSFHDSYNSTPNIFKEIPVLHKPAQFILWFFDYHHIYHHDSDINKQPFYVIMEFINNLWMEGLEIVVLLLIAKYIPIEPILVWCLVYATAHQVNYIISPCLQHIRHHKKAQTNYGFDIYDIVFGSKYDMGSYENYNDTAINLIISFIIVFYFRKLIRNTSLYKLFERK